MLAERGLASNYDFAVLHANAGFCGVSCFPMTPADLEGTAERTSIVPRGRFEQPFADHAIPEGVYRVAGYILRIPSHGGHWVALVPPEDPTDRDAGCAMLCDSLYPAPVLLQPGEMLQLLTAAAFDAAAARRFDPCGFNSQWGCFLAGVQ